MRRSKTSKESVIVSNSYERHSFWRFFLIYLSVLLLLFTALAALYYYKERGRYFQEQKLKNRLAFSECTHLKKMLPSAPECEMAPVVIDDKLRVVYREIGIAFLLSLLLIVPVGLLLARISLRPMRDSVEAMDAFINGIVHDINTPLSVIRMNAHSLLPRLEDERLRRKGERVLQGVEHIEALEEQLLFSLRIGQYEPRLRYFDLCALLRERRSYWASNRSRVEVEISAPSSCLVQADEKALLRMIDNIVGNAVKYSPPDSRVRVACAKGVLKISDEGEGIRDPRAVFRKYYRENRTVKGVGLGLYIVSEIARMHGIGIRIRSARGRGTTFELDLHSILSTPKQAIITE